MNKIKNFIKKFKLLLISLGILGVAGAATLGLQPADIAIIQVFPVEKIAPVNVFKDRTTGELIYIETTKTDYQTIDVKNGKIPAYPNADWAGSSSNMDFTPSLKNGEYKIVDATTTPKALIKLPDLLLKKIDTSYISDNKITQTELNQINQ